MTKILQDVVVTVAIVVGMGVLGWAIGITLLRVNTAMYRRHR